MTAMQQEVTLLPLHCNKTCKTILTHSAIHDTLYRKSHHFCRKVQSGEDLFPHEDFYRPATHPIHFAAVSPDKIFRLTCRAVLFFYGTGTANLSPNHDKEAT